MQWLLGINNNHWEESLSSSVVINRFIHINCEINRALSHRKWNLLATIHPIFFGPPFASLRVWFIANSGDLMPECQPIGPTLSAITDQSFASLPVKTLLSSTGLTIGSKRCNHAMHSMIGIRQITAYFSRSHDFNVISNFNKSHKIWKSRKFREISLRNHFDIIMDFYKHDIWFTFLVSLRVSRVKGDRNHNFSEHVFK